jgi:predicted amidohydrolase
MRALLAQLEPAPADPGANVRQVARALAAHPEADLAVVPELFLTGYDPRAAAATALPADGDELGKLRRVAAEHGTAVVAGFAEAAGGGRTANAAACIDRDGSLRGVYRKTHLFGADERAAFAAGDALVVCELAGVRIGPMICFDVEFPEPARALARAGAELLVTVAANPEPYGPDHELAARARALDNRLPHLYVNRTGAQAGLDFAGASAAIGPDGSVLASAGGSPRSLCVDVDTGARPHPDVAYLEHVRPDLRVDDLARPLTQGATR